MKGEEINNIDDFLIENLKARRRGEWENNNKWPLSCEVRRMTCKQEWQCNKLWDAILS